MLLSRVVTALVITSIVVLAVLKLSNPYFAYFWGAIILLGAWEWSNLAEIKKVLFRILFVISVLIALTMFMYVPAILQVFANLSNDPDIMSYATSVDWLILPVIFWWLLTSVRLRNSTQEIGKIGLLSKNKLFIGWFVLVLAWLSMVRLRYHGPEIVLYLVFLIAIADMSAYFVGRKYGKSKLSPHISPGKTFAGMYGALIASLVVAIGFGFYFEFGTVTIADFTLLSFITVMFSISGDLFESLAKRIRGVKDSGSILPGHGGILDRIDSHLAATPVFYVGILLMKGQLV